MKKYGSKLSIAFALTVGILLGMAAIGRSQQSTVSALAPPVTHSPSDLSLAFREVSQKVLPAVVSITAETKARELTAQELGQLGNQFEQMDEEMLRRFFGGNSPFGQMFQLPRQIPKQQGAGSGFLVNPDGIILTNSHVVENADKITVRLADGREFAAKSWNFDPRSDVAVVRIDAGEKLPFLALGNSDGMEIGDWVLALGNPLSVGTTVTAGIVSATGRAPGINEREGYIQTDAAINPGNSGGPLVNLHGEVIGINTAISTRSGGYDGIGFAIPSKMVRWVSDQLIETGEVRRSYLGVQLQMISDQLRQQFGLQVGEGALVSDVVPESPAANSDLQPGDVILEFNGQKVRDREQLVDLVERAAPNEEYSLSILRGGKPVNVTVRLEQMPSDYTAALKRGLRHQAEEESRPVASEVQKLGIQLINLTADLAQQLNISDIEQGVVVKEVAAGSPADEAGLESGDVIRRVGQREVSSVSEFAEAIEDMPLSKGILLHVKRQSGAAFIVLKSDS